MGRDSERDLPEQHRGHRARRRVGLDQKQSHSVNTASTGNLVTIGLGTIAADNASNPSTFPADRSFPIWGDDAGGIVLATVVPGAAIGTRRLSRVWRAQETGTVGSVLVRMPGRNRRRAAGAHPERRPTFDTSDTLVPLTLNGSDYQAHTHFADGEFFTFAAVVGDPGVWAVRRCGSKPTSACSP